MPLLHHRERTHRTRARLSVLICAYRYPLEFLHLMRLARSFWWKAFVTLLAAGAFVSLYEVTILDSKFSMLPLALERFFDPSAPPAPGARLAFSATAYCKGATTSGVAAQNGVSPPTRHCCRSAP